jgi:hypothetical protein
MDKKYEIIFVVVSFLVTWFFVFPIQNWENSIVGNSISDASHSIFMIWTSDKDGPTGHNSWIYPYKGYDFEAYGHEGNDYMPLIFFTATPTLYFTGQLVLTYNLTIAFQMFLLYIFTYIFIKKVTNNAPISIIASLIPITSNYLFTTIMYGHYDYLALFPIPFVLWAIDTYFERKTNGSVFILFVSFVSFLLSSYHMIYNSMIFLIFPYTVWKYIRNQKKGLIRFTTVLFFATLIVIPWWAPRLRHFPISEFLVGLDNMSFCSPDSSVDICYKFHPMYFIIILGLVAIGLKKEPFFVLLFLFSMTLSMFNPIYWFFFNQFPLFNVFRAPYRFAFLAWFSLAIVIGTVFSEINKSIRSRKIKFVLVLIFLVATIQCNGFWDRVVHMQTPTITLTETDFFEPIVDKNLTVLHYPMEYLESDMASQSLYFLPVYYWFVTIHHNSIANIYAVNYPQQYLQDKQKIFSPFFNSPTEEGLDLICESGIEVIICHNCSEGLVGFMDDNSILISEGDLAYGRLFYLDSSTDLSLGRSHMFELLC